MKHLPVRILFFVSLCLLIGCGHQQAGKVAPQQANTTSEPVDASEDAPVLAQRIEGWDGINNLFSEGDIYFSGQPDSASFVRLADELNIATIISLKRTEELEQLPFDEIQLISDLGMSFVQIPIAGDALSRDHAVALKEALDTVDRPVLIHCGSSNRVGATWAAHLLIDEGLSLEEALERGRAAGLTVESLVEAVKRIAEEEAM